MKRLFLVIGGAVFGLLLTFINIFFASQIDWPISNTPAGGCYEIDKCNVPWWIVALFISWWLGPTIVCAGVAFVAIRNAWPQRKVVFTLLIVAVISAMFYVSWYAYKAYR